MLIAIGARHELPVAFHPEFGQADRRRLGLPSRDGALFEARSDEVCKRGQHAGFDQHDARVNQQAKHVAPSRIERVRYQKVQDGVVQRDQSGCHQQDEGITKTGEHRQDREEVEMHLHLPRPAGKNENQQRGLPDKADTNRKADKSDRASEKSKQSGNNGKDRREHGDRTDRHAEDRSQENEERDVDECERAQDDRNDPLQLPKIRHARTPRDVEQPRRRLASIMNHAPARSIASPKSGRKGCTTTTNG